MHALVTSQLDFGNAALCGITGSGRMPERGLTFNPGFNSGTKLVPMPDNSLKLVRMPEGRLTLDPGLALWIKAQELVLLQGRISCGLAPKVSVL